MTAAEWSAARHADLVASTVTGEWTEPIVQLCKPTPPEPCDCGFAGHWLYRKVMTWEAQPGHKRSDRAIRADIERKWPPRPNDEGWWCTTGFDERCPGCGDIERFDLEGAEVARFAEQAKVVIFLDARRRRAGIS